MRNFYEWMRKMAGGALVYKPGEEKEIQKSAGGWWGDPRASAKSMNKKSQKKSKK